MAPLRLAVLLLWLTAAIDRGLAIKCHECGRFSKERGIIEACNKSQTTDDDRKECHHTSILCLKHVNGDRMVKMCTDYCVPYETHGGETFCCSMPDYCNDGRRPTAAAGAAVAPALVLAAGWRTITAT